MRSRKMGFSLAEILIALVLLGAIAAFTIPKLLQNTSNAREAAIAKEGMSALSEVYQKALLANELISGVTRSTDLLKRLNATDITGQNVEIDKFAGDGHGNCNEPFRICYLLPNGAIITTGSDGLYIEDINDGITHAMLFTLDPDSRYSGGIAGNRQSVQLILFTNGKITSMGKLATTITTTAADLTTLTFSPGSDTDPAWFKF